MNAHPRAHGHTPSVTRSALALQVQGGTIPAAGGAVALGAGAEQRRLHRPGLEGASGEAVARRFAAPRRAVLAHPKLSYCLLLVALFALALWSRYRYVLGDYTYTFGSGDAHLILTKALLLHEGIVRTSPELVPVSQVFDQPPLIPLALAGVSLVTSMPLEVVTFVIVPVLTSVALVVFLDLVRRTFDMATAVISTALLAILPRFSFDSTEPEKAPFVVSFVVIALWLLVRSKDVRGLLPLSGLFLGLAVFAHTTGYLFIPVFILSYLTLRGLSRRSAFDPLFLLSLGVTAFFIVAYFFLARLGESATATTGEVPDTGPLPAFVQTYVDSLARLFSSRFTDRAWNLYFDAIRGHLTAPIYAAAIAGFVMVLAAAVRSRRHQTLPIAFWMLIVTLGFAAQYPANSHASRYPQYVSPAFLVLAAFFVVQTFRWLGQRQRLRSLALAAGVVLAAATIGQGALTYARASSPGLRDLYGGHRDLATFVTSRGLLDDGSHVLYLGWPSVTLYLLQEDVGYRDQLHTFGFGMRDLDELTPAFVRQHNIRYFADDHVGSDGFGSADAVMANLAPYFRMQQLGRFGRRMGNYVTLYELLDIRPPYKDALQDYLRRIDTGADARNLTTNPTLRWQRGTVLPGWDPNGRVRLQPLTLNGASGVLVRNSAEFGGIRQLINAGLYRERTVTAIAEIQAAPPFPAHSAVLALSEEGAPPMKQTLVPLEPGSNVLALEAELPADVGLLRITIATGEDDSGDIVVERLYLVPSPLSDIISAQAATG